jgi:arylsulfatase A-like enzyme
VVEASLGMGQGFDLYHDERTGRDVSADEIKDRARRWLQSRSDDRPFFLYLHFMDVHDPWNAPRRDFDALRDHVAGADRLLQPPEVPPEEIEIRPDWASDEMRLQMGYWKTRYASGVRAFDRRFAPFLRYLRESGILDDSYLVLTSDHGDEMYENGRWGHGYSLYEHQLHVPLLVRRPGGADAGRAVPEMVGLIDLMPTLLKLAGVDPPDGIRGKDISMLLDGGSTDRPPLFFASSMMWGPDIYSVRTERHKLIADTAGDWVQLFDLIQDPTEQNDLADANEELALAMRELIDEHLKATEHGRLERETREIEEDLLERLRSLGYVE